MKTSLEIEDSLFKRAKLAAVKNDSTLRELVERGLRRELAALEAEESREAPNIDLKKVAYHGDSSAALPMSWDEVRDLAYGVESDVEKYGRR